MIRITVAKGDGIDSEIINAALANLLAADAQIELDEIDVGEHFSRSDKKEACQSELSGRADKGF
jgi:isocitrate/isopropylmalate dehydrogenase